MGTPASFSGACAARPGRTEQRRAAGCESSLDSGGISKIGTQTAQADRGEVNKAWFLTVLLFAVVATMNAVLMLPPLLVDIAGEFGAPVSVMGQLATVTFGFWAVSVLLASPLSDSFGRRPVAVVGLLALSVSVMASAFAPNFYVLLALRVLTGLGGGTIPPNAIAAVSDIISPERRGQAVGGLMAVNVLTAATTVPIMALLADWGNWRLPFLVSGLMLAASLAAVWIWLPGGMRERSRSFAFLSRYWSLLSPRSGPGGFGAFLPGGVRGGSHPADDVLGERQLFRRVPDRHPRGERGFRGFAPSHYGGGTGGPPVSAWGTW